MMLITRRHFAAALGCAAAWPITARAQQSRQIGVLMQSVSTDATNQAYLRAFREQLRRLGWIEGQNLHIEYRWNAGDAALRRTYAAELVGLSADVILSSTTNNLTALQRLSPATPIVFVNVSDPVTQGFVVNMAHPGANVTGFALYEFTIGAKWVDLLKQMVPTITHVGVMFNPQTSPQFKFFMDSISAAAPTLGVRAAAVPVQSIAEIEQAISNAAHEPHGGLIAPPDTFLNVHRKLVVETAARYRVPAIYQNADAVREGGLMGYFTELTDQFRQAGVYADRILKGTKAGDLPVQTPTKFSLSINLKAARDLGIEVPLSLLLIADEQVE